MLCLRVASLTGTGAVTEEAWHRIQVFFLETFNQGESQGVCGCEVADEPVVVLNVQPMKASNGVEEKTGRIFNLI